LNYDSHPEEQAKLKLEVGVVEAKASLQELIVAYYLESMLLKLPKAKNDL